MQINFLKRLITSFFLLSILLIIYFSNELVFVLSILIVSLIICVETNNIFLKLKINKKSKKKVNTKKINFIFFSLNLIAFLYIFFVFCNLSFAIYKFESPTYFLYIICICFFTDIGGYIVGKTLGGPKLTKISPNKTISGTLGSFIFSIIPLFIFFYLGYLDIKININNIIFCLLVSLVSQLGDLFISYLKRKADIKDTGKMLPGHGGILDRVDGIIFAVPFSYFLLKLF
jgi:phosphatidate cytidylyltransferase